MDLKKIRVCFKILCDSFSVSVSFHVRTHTTTLLDSDSQPFFVTSHSFYIKEQLGINPNFDLLEKYANFNYWLLLNNFLRPPR